MISMGLPGDTIPILIHSFPKSTDMTASPQHAGSRQVIDSSVIRNMERRAILSGLPPVT